MITIAMNQRLLPAKHRLSRARLTKLSKAFAKHVPEQAQGEVEVTFISDTEIQRLNRMYRGKDKVTDVLSFASGQQQLTGQLGDVLISYDQAVRQAADGDIELELADLIVHGLLHLLGYDHERPTDAALMFPLQDVIVADSL
jgi:probable rRNA maturation factor